MECGYNFNGWKDYVSKINVYCITVVPVRSCGIEDTDFAGKYVGDRKIKEKKASAVRKYKLKRLNGK